MISLKYKNYYSISPKKMLIFSAQINQKTKVILQHLPNQKFVLKKYIKFLFFFWILIEKKYTNKIYLEQNSECDFVIDESTLLITSLYINGVIERVSHDTHN